MPRIDIPGKYRFSFVSFDLTEPCHVPVREGTRGAKLWIASMVFAWSDFKPHENAEILRIATEHLTLIEGSWLEHERRAGNQD